jgi:hypothetical protein
MSKYTIKLNYIASYVAVVEGNFRNEGDALEAARNQAEDADMNEFTIGEESASQILEVR